MAYKYIVHKELKTMPRLPLRGKIDLTYRCNNNCRHCWLRIPRDSAKQKEEASLAEIKRIVDEARIMGCSQWHISGGEPMLRPDFYEIFDYLTSRCTNYSMNTNGTLITPKIARLLRRKGNKMVSLYGATKETHDHITRNPGSFEATRAGFAYLKEAGSEFTVQLVPMKDNFHQLGAMVSLAQSLSNNYRFGASWLFLSASGNKAINKEIIRQRLPPDEVVQLDKPDLCFEEAIEKDDSCDCRSLKQSKYLFSSCIALKRDFHINPYMQMSFCGFIQEKALRYDLSKGNFKECWKDFIPSLANKLTATKEYKDNCGFCKERTHCLVCPVYSYLEHRNFNRKVDYLCAIAKKRKKYKEDWRANHRRFYKIWDMTIQVDTDLPNKANLFQPQFKCLETDMATEDDVIKIRHHFSLPDLVHKSLGVEVYGKPNLSIYKNRKGWIYLTYAPFRHSKMIVQVAVFNSEYTRAEIYHSSRKVFDLGSLLSPLCFFYSSMFLANVLANRRGCYFHSSAAKLGDHGLLFAACSGGGKSTMIKMLKSKADIIGDERIIMRQNKDGFRLYGAWHHGYNRPDVLRNSAPLKAILFLEKAKVNQLIRIQDNKEINRRLLGVLVRPFETKDWWEKNLTFIESISSSVPCYTLKFDLSGRVVDLLKRLKG